MLTSNDERSTVQAPAASPTPNSGGTKTEAAATKSLLARAMRLEWLGQTVASLCWIASVFTYGISASGDWLQLCAASAWLVANIASIATAEPD